MFYVRTTKTASSATAVQIVEYVNRKTKVVAHIGSSHNKDELFALKQEANLWIEKSSRQNSLLPAAKTSSLVALDKCRLLDVRHSFIREVLNKLFSRFRFNHIGSPLLRDLAIIRLIEPASKLRSLELLKEYFGLHYREKDMYLAIPKFGKFKDKVEERAVDLAKQELDFSLSLVFYDVTTLYFESFHADELRKQGFSKDNKSQQPQIVIGLVVTESGFPVAYEIFEGNKFEGHTLIPVITAFKRKHDIEIITVVADAAMLSLENIRALEIEGIKYIVGARIGNLPFSLIKTVCETLSQKDGSIFRGAALHGELICDFSSKRYAKDKHDMERQIKKAEELLKNSSAMKRTKFVKTAGTARYALNAELVEKSKMLLGIKGYYTNLGKEMASVAIINHYHNLWKVEHAFRIAKSDLQIRPVYHFKQEAIKTHVLICFMALAVSKYLEIKTGQSIASIIKLLKSVVDVRILNTLNQTEVMLRSDLTEDIKRLIERMGLPH